MGESCILCEAVLAIETMPVAVTPLTQGPICETCATLPPADRDVLRTRAMTRMLRTVGRRTP